ncbi:hypothetical protein [Mycolicibacterium chlorophenolicum]|nr:hypothetical protein [Mycolicibacterium chlorophenolicum]
MAVRKLAARTAVTASRKSGRPVDPQVQALAALPIRPEDQATRRGYSIAVRKAASRAAVTASKKTGRPVDPRTLGLAD